MGNRYDIIKGIVPVKPDPTPIPPRMSKKDRLEEELRFLHQAYDKAPDKEVFRSRLGRLYLEDQISEKAYNKTLKMMGFKNVFLQDVSLNSGGSCGSINGGRC